MPTCRHAHTHVCVLQSTRRAGQGATPRTVCDVGGMYWRSSRRANGSQKQDLGIRRRRAAQPTGTCQAPYVSDSGYGYRRAIQWSSAEQRRAAAQEEIRTNPLPVLLLGAPLPCTAQSHQATVAARIVKNRPCPALPAKVASEAKSMPLSPPRMRHHHHRRCAAGSSNALPTGEREAVRPKGRRSKAGEGACWCAWGHGVPHKCCAPRACVSGHGQWPVTGMRVLRVCLLPSWGAPEHRSIAGGERHGARWRPMDIRTQGVGSGGCTQGAHGGGHARMHAGHSTPVHRAQPATHARSEERVV